MRRVSVLAAAALGVLAFGGIAAADSASPSIWSQTPDMVGGLAYSSEVKVPSTVADNWTCADEDLSICEITWWGSYWKTYEAGAYATNSSSLPNAADGGIMGFTITFWTNTPADPAGINYARPGTEIWSYWATNFTETDYGTTSNGRDVQEYSVYIPEAKQFVHQKGAGETQYWISIVADLRSPIGNYDSNRQWGWMESANSESNAPACVQDFKNSRWSTISNNLYNSDMSFVIETASMPEPGTFASLAAGLVGMLGFASGIRRRR